MKLLLFLLVAIFPFIPGKPVGDVKIFIENRNGNNIAAFQNTGEKGKVSFKHLNSGTYQLVMEFPQQTGRWIKTKRRFNTLTKASYNPQNKTYYYQGEEGFFSIKLERTRRIDLNSFKPVFKERRGEEKDLIVVSQFEARNRGAQISLKVKALTSRQYKKLTRKKGSTVSTISIPGAR